MVKSEDASDGSNAAQTSDLLRRFLASADAPCPTCGYNLRGCADNKCPECGAPVRLGLAPWSIPRKLTWLPVVALVLAVIFSAIELSHIVSTSMMVSRSFGTSWLRVDSLTFMIAVYAMLCILALVGLGNAVQSLRKKQRAINGYLWAVVFLIADNAVSIVWYLLP